MNLSLNQAMRNAAKSFQAPTSNFQLVLAIIANCLWLLSKSLKIILILNKEMFSHLLRGSQQRRAISRSANIFNHYGVWMVDLYGLIHEQLGMK